MRIARQLTLSYLLVFTVLVGAITFFVGSLVYRELLGIQKVNAQALVDNVNRMLEGNLKNSIRSYLQLNDQELVIKGATEEQDVGNAHVLESIGVINDITGQVKDRAIQMLEGGREALAEMDRLSAATQAIVGSMNEMSAGTQLIHSAVERANSISIENKKSADRLNEEVSRFKAE